MVTFCFRKLLWMGCILFWWPSIVLLGQRVSPSGFPRNPTSPDPTTYSLAALIDSAQHHLPVLRQKMALVEAAKAGIRDARDAYLPASFIGDEVLVGSD